MDSEDGGVMPEVELEGGAGTGVGSLERETFTPAFSFRTLHAGGCSLAGLAAADAGSPEHITCRRGGEF